MAKQQTAPGKKKTFKKKEKKVVPQGIVHIQATFNNTMISITDLQGNLVSQSSAGAMVSAARARARPSPRSRPPPRRRVSLATAGCARSKCASKARARDENRRFAPFRLRESTSG